MAIHEKFIEQQTITKSSDRLDIGFLHASPLIYKDKVIKTSPQLNFIQEAKTIKTAMKKTKQNIRFKSMVATKKNLSDMLQLKPQVLHISCHGIELP